MKGNKTPPNVRFLVDKNRGGGGYTITAVHKKVTRPPQIKAPRPLLADVDKKETMPAGKLEEAVSDCTDGMVAVKSPRPRPGPRLKQKKVLEGLKGQVVIGRDDETGMYYEGVVLTCPNPRNARVKRYHDNKTMTLSTRHILPIKGAISMPPLRVGDYALVKVRSTEGDGQGEMYIPAIVQMCPVVGGAPLYSVLTYNRQQIVTTRRYLVKISKERFNFTVDHITLRLKEENEIYCKKPKKPDPHIKIHVEYEHRQERTVQSKKSTLKQSRSKRKEKRFADISIPDESDDNQYNDGSDYSDSNDERNDDKDDDFYDDDSSSVTGDDKDYDDDDKDKDDYDDDANHKSSGKEGDSHQRQNGDGSAVEGNEDDEKSDEDDEKSDEDFWEEKKETKETDKEREREEQKHVKSKRDNKTDKERRNKRKEKKNTRRRDRKEGSEHSLESENEDSTSEKHDRPHSSDRDRHQKANKKRGNKRKEKKKRNGERRQSEQSLESEDDEHSTSEVRDHPPRVDREHHQAAPVLNLSGDIREFELRLRELQDQLHRQDEAHSRRQQEVVEKLKELKKEQKKHSKRQGKQSHISVPREDEGVVHEEYWERREEYSERREEYSERREEHSERREEYSERREEHSERQEVTVVQDSEERVRRLALIEMRRTLRPVDKLEEVLVRWPDDGWYYRGVVRLVCGDYSYIVQDGTGEVARIWREDILTETDDAKHVLQVNDVVVALHPSYSFRYAPARVITTLSSLKVKVCFYDNQVSDVERDEVYKATAVKHVHDVAEIRKCERQWVGQPIVARNDHTGLYSLGCVSGQMSDQGVYQVTWCDGSTCTQTPTHMFGPFTRKHRLAVGDRVLAVENSDTLDYLPGWIIGEQDGVLTVKFCSGQVRDDVVAESSYWLNLDYFDAAVTFYNQRHV